LANFRKNIKNAKTEQKKNVPKNDANC